MARIRSKHRHKWTPMEALESRILLSSVTLITHGYEPTDPNLPIWVETMAQAVAAREGGASIYQFVLGYDSSDNLQAQSFTQVSGPNPKTSANGDVIIELNWVAD